MGFQSKSGAAAALALVLTSCGGEAVRGPEDPGPRPGRLPQEEALEALEALERTFYVHWGAVEGTAEYARLGEGHAAALRQVADVNGAHALMALRVLERLAPAERFSADARAILYVTALERERNFARWGIFGGRGFIPAVYGQELLRLGPAAAPYLKRLLGDRRRAPLRGDPEGERANRLQGDRVCDYAWVLLSLMFDRPLAYTPDPRGRDPQIRDLDAWLDRR